MQSLKLNLRIDVIVQIDKNISPGGLGTRLIDDMYTQLQLLSFMLFSQCRHRHHTLNMCHQYFLFFLRRSVPTLEMEAARDWWHTQLQSLTIILFSWRKNLYIERCGTGIVTLWILRSFSSTYHKRMSWFLAPNLQACSLVCKKHEVKRCDLKRQ